MGIILDGRPVATAILGSLQDVLAERAALGKAAPHLAIVMVGDNPDSAAYAASKAKVGRRLGMTCDLVTLPATIRLQELIDRLDAIGQDPSVNGILVELPLPRGLDMTDVFCPIPVAKDVEGMSLESAGRLVSGCPLFIPATPAAVIRIMDHYGLELQGKEVVVVGRSRIVGRPLASLLLTRNATVTVCHRFTQDLAFHTRRADVLIAAAGQPHLIGADHVKPGAVVIDVGTTYEGNGPPRGDVDFAGVQPVAAGVTPVPGGVGPVTTAIILSNVLTATDLQERRHTHPILQGTP